MENANQGLDHGYGNVMFAMGAGVKGGYYGTWPGLTNTSTPTCWSPPTTAASSARWSATRMGASTASVFPGLSATDDGVHDLAVSHGQLRPGTVLSAPAPSAGFADEDLEPSVCGQWRT